MVLDCVRKKRPRVSMRYTTPGRGAAITKGAIRPGNVQPSVATPFFITYIS